MYKWFLVSKYLRTKLVALFGIAAVMLCVAMVLVVTSVMGGFLDTIRTRSRGLLSEIVVGSRSLQGFPYYEEFSRELQAKIPDVVRVVTPAVQTYGIFRVPATAFTNPTRVLGIRLDEYVKVNDFKRGLYYDRYFPGTTHLGEQGMSAAGIDEEGHIRLPAEFIEANENWRKNETDPKEIAAFDADPFALAPHPDINPRRSAQRVFSVVEGEPTVLPPLRHGVIVGCDLLHYRRPDGNFDRNITRGAEVALTLVPLSLAGNPTGEPPVRVPLRYIDDSRTGVYEIDSMASYVDFDLLQHQLAMDAQPLVDGTTSQPRITQLLIALQPGVDLNESRARIERIWEDFRVSLGTSVTPSDDRAMSFVEISTWEDLQRQFINAVEKEKYLMLIILAIVCIVAIVLLGLIFYMIVEKKTRDIGILKAVGARSRGIAGMFVGYAAAVGVVGSALGILIGALFVWNINDIQDLLANLNPALRVWSPDIYSFDRIPETVKRIDIVWISGAAVLASIAGSLIPAWIASRVWPVRALRYE